MNTNILGKRLKLERLKKGWTQEELANRLNVTKQTISNWENGERIPDTLMLANIAQLFDIKTDYLLGIDEASPDTKNFITRKLRDDLYVHFEDTKDMEKKIEVIEKVLKVLENGKEK